MYKNPRPETVHGCRPLCRAQCLVPAGIEVSLEPACCCPRSGVVVSAGDFGQRWSTPRGRECNKWRCHLHPSGNPSAERPATEAVCSAAQPPFRWKRVCSLPQPPTARAQGEPSFAKRKEKTETSSRLHGEKSIIPSEPGSDIGAPGQAWLLGTCRRARSLDTPAA